MTKDGKQQNDAYADKQQNDVDDGWNHVNNDVPLQPQTVVATTPVLETQATQPTQPEAVVATAPAVAEAEAVVGTQQPQAGAPANQLAELSEDDKKKKLAELGATPKNPEKEGKESDTSSHEKLAKKLAKDLKRGFRTFARGAGFHPLLNEYVDGNNRQNIMNNMKPETKNGIENTILEIKKKGYTPPKFSKFDSLRGKCVTNMENVGTQYLEHLQEIQDLLPDPPQVAPQPNASTNPKVTFREQVLKSLDYMKNNIKKVGKWVKQNMSNRY
ncbi:MAG: hypothetical protein EB127_07755 [Alphaproteobacteria bacterium]|nr:hypothetical protein [Alphaproteobacteria bacterium]